MSKLTLIRVFAMYLLLSFLVLAHYSFVFGADGPLSYDHQGKDWEGLCQYGKLQSPINIKTHLTKKVEDGQPIVFINYDRQWLNALLTESSVKISRKVVLDELKVGIAGAGLKGFYKFDSAHLHWESEHKINGRKFPLELHLVHYNEKYGSFQEAVKHPEGLAVVGVLYEATDDNDELLMALTDLLDDSPKTSLPYIFTAADLLPTNGNYYTYDGSLTTPPCSESVVWIVMENKRSTTHFQANWFSTKDLEGGSSIEDTSRVTYPLNGRVVQHIQIKQFTP